jgi:RNA polymerase sigma-70 factor (ECF subfamily)
VLRNWDAELGLSLANYVGLIAERRTISALRSGKSNPWREESGGDDLDYSADSQGVEHEVTQQDRFARLVDAMREALSPQGWHLFDLLYIQEREVDEVCEQTGLSADAVYAWRSRLRRTARQQFAKLEADSAPGQERAES